MKNTPLPAFFLVLGLIILPAVGHTAAATPPGCYATALNQNNLKGQFENDPDAKLTVAREAVDFMNQYVDVNGRIKAASELPADAIAAFAALKLRPGDLIPGGTPIGRMQEIAERITSMAGPAETINAFREQVAAALFSRDVADILDVAHLGGEAFTQILAFTNLDAMTLANLTVFQNLPIEQLSGLISGLQSMPQKLQAWADGTMSAAQKQAMDLAMAKLGITMADATALVALYNTDPRQMLADLAGKVQGKITEVGLAGLNQIKESMMALVGNMGIASAMTDLFQQGSAFVTNLLSQLPLDPGMLTGALTDALKNIFGNMFNLNWLFGGKALGEDFGYKDEELQGLDKVWGPQPSTPMPHKRTPILSALKDLNKWYLTNIQMPATAAEAEKTQVTPDLRSFVGQSAPYVGAAYRGENDLGLFRQRMNQAGAGTFSTTCSQLIEPASGKADPYDPAWARVDLDACVNQWILNHARYVRMVHEQAGSYRYINETMCQSMRVIPLTSEDKEDYNPSEYLGIAWDKLLNNSSKLMRGGKAKTEPHYESGGTAENHGSFNIKISTPIPVPAQFGAISINDLTEKVPERIFDPSHPFSPRWDYEDNERDKYSHLTGYDAAGVATLSSVRCAGSMVNRIPVDLMNFRLQKKFYGANFHYWIMQRIAGNYLALTTRLADGETIWDHYNCSASEPCCSTAYDVSDKLGEPLRTMMCGQPRIKDMCAYMAKPLAPLNLLKQRDATDPNIFPDNDGDGYNDVPDGYKFSTYFGNHRPYMRCWDTGSECGSITSAPDWESKAGSNYAIMGAGREGQSCKIGGDGIIDLIPPQDKPFKDASPTLDWMELKLYQISAQRRLGLKCIPRHEESFKIGQGEHFALYKGGIEVPQPDPKDPTRSINYTWPWGWRGYVIDPVTADRFPNFGATTTPATQVGLDDALQGDVLIFDSDVVDKKRLPYVGIVVEQNNRRSNSEATDDDSFVSMYSINHGKFPDACANTDRLFTGTKLTLWKTKLPADVDQMLNDLGATSGKATKQCDDPALSNCIEPLWGKVKRYRFVDDKRN